MASKTQTELQSDAIKSIASVSTLLRRAIGASLPVAPEQYMTVAIPGTVIDLEDVDQGGSFVYDVGRHAVPPTAVRQAEARLVDGMMPIASIMIGNTGKSVARSYARSLDGMVPRKATFSTSSQIRSPGEKMYDDAMDFLTRKNEEKKTAVDTYRDKEIAWGKARSAWDEAKIKAEQYAEKKYPASSGGDYIGRQKQYINDWHQMHYYQYKAAVQSAWMDWVVIGQKYNVDYNFGMIDIDSIMARIEASKESLRNSTIPDSDGANELYGVSLTPNRWATYCKRKAEGWYARNGNYTLSQIDAEIARLEGLLNSYGMLETVVKEKTYPVKDAHQPSVTLQEARTDLDARMGELYSAQGTLAGAKYNANQLNEKKDAKDDEKKEAQEKVKAAQEGVTKARTSVQEKQKVYDNAVEDWNEYNFATLQGNAGTEVNSWLTNKKTTIQGQLKQLNDLREAKVKGDSITVPVITGVTLPSNENDKETPHATNVAPEGAELANPMFGIKPKAIAGGTLKTSNAPLAAGEAAGGSGQSAEDADPWTTITFSYSASDLESSASQSSWGMTVGGSVGFGLWSIGGAYAHDESHSDVQSDMASCDVSVSFSALVVNINRPWLYGEIFNDIDLEVAEGVNLSPGPLRLQDMIKSQKIGDIDQYSQFPAYPTSFIVAADTTIEFNGATKHIEQHFNSHSNSGNVSVGYGPWSVSSSFHEAGSKQSLQMHATATGCKLTFGAPQVIAWVSQILPALPRQQNHNPLTQGAGLPVPT